MTEPLIMPDLEHETVLLLPLCPATCCFNRHCPERTQAGVSGAFRSGKMKEPTDCGFFDMLATEIRKLFGVEPPSSSDELLQLLGTVRTEIASPGDLF